jgi:hypothetical protein
MGCGMKNFLKAASVCFWVMYSHHGSISKIKNKPTVASTDLNNNTSALNKKLTKEWNK